MLVSWPVQSLPRARSKSCTVWGPSQPKLRKDTPSEYLEIFDKRFETLETVEEKPIAPSVLALPRLQRACMVDKDACCRHIGCVRLQRQPDEHKNPIGYWSCCETDAEQTCDTTHRECLAVVWAILFFHLYAAGTCTTICKDHDVFKWIFVLEDATK